MKQQTTMKLLAGCIAVVTVLVFATACQNEPDPCKCTEKDHLGINEECKCGGANCKCGLKVYHNIVDIDRGVDIKVYRSGNVSETEMQDAVIGIIAGFDALAGGEKRYLADKIDEIYVLGEFEGYYFYKYIDGKKVLGATIEGLEYAAYLLRSISNGTIEIARIKESIRPANTPAIQKSAHIAFEKANSRNVNAIVLVTAFI